MALGASKDALEQIARKEPWFKTVLALWLEALDLDILISYENISELMITRTGKILNNQAWINVCDTLNTVDLARATGSDEDFLVRVDLSFTRYLNRYDEEKPYGKFQGDGNEHVEGDEEFKTNGGKTTPIQMGGSAGVT